MSLESRVIRACWTCPATSAATMPGNFLLQQPHPGWVGTVASAGGCNKTAGAVGPIPKSDLPCHTTVETCHATTQLLDLPCDNKVTPATQQHRMSFHPAQLPSCSQLRSLRCAAKTLANGHAMMPQCTRTKTSSTCTQCPPGTGRADCLPACVYAGCTHSLLNLALGQCYTGAVAQHHTTSVIFGTLHAAS
jgi:hypothetical protein